MLDLSLYSAARKIQTYYNAAFRSAGFPSLTYTQFVTLRELWNSGAPLSEKEIGRRLTLDSGTLTPVVKKLETDGLIAKHRSKEDERVVIISLTEEGSSLRDRISEPSIPLPAGSAEKLEQLLQELKEAFEKE